MPDTDPVTSWNVGNHQGSLPLEEYAIIGDTHSVALVGRNGSIDWLCLPRFDSGACFAKLLGTEENGFWRIAPLGECTEITRRYVGDTLVLETEFHTESGSVRITDCMPIREEQASVVRMVEGISGAVPMRMELAIRFDYGWIIPWMRMDNDHLHGDAGPDSVCLATSIPIHGESFRSVSEFTVGPGEKIPFVFSWHPALGAGGCGDEAFEALSDTTTWWREWSARCTYVGPWREAVIRSLITLKALTYQPTGGMVAAATTSLPELLGGSRNWDYRYCWLRDAAFALEALMSVGYVEEAIAWREWLLLAAAGDPSQLQIMYGPGGERRLTELELEWLVGYEGSHPVRIGNAASSQVQLDVFGEVLDALHSTREAGATKEDSAWDLQTALIEHVELHWREPDEGIWEVRTAPRHFTHSKVMAWVAIDRAVKAINEFGLSGPIERWTALRDEIKEEVCTRALDPLRGHFVRSYDSLELDASLLLLPAFGFIESDDPRMLLTIEAIQQDLMQDGFLLRYRIGDDRLSDGLTGEEGAFLACSFWYVDTLANAGKIAEASEMYDSLLALRNDVGLLSEEYDLVNGRLVGNFPQAFSHVGVINSALNLALIQQKSEPTET